MNIISYLMLTITYNINNITYNNIIILIAIRSN